MAVNGGFSWVVGVDGSISCFGVSIHLIIFLLMMGLT